MRSINKKGQEKYYIIISLILGLMVLSLSLYFIFNEYFTEDEADWEICRQSVLLRAKAVGDRSNLIAWAAENFPFKCKTEVVNIDYKNYDKAGFAIVDAMASCKALYDEGQLYGQGGILEGRSHCFHCSRIHFTEDVRDFYSPKKILDDLIHKDELEVLWAEVVLLMEKHDTNYPQSEEDLDVKIKEAWDEWGLITDGGGEGPRTELGSLSEGDIIIEGSTMDRYVIESIESDGQNVKITSIISNWEDYNFMVDPDIIEGRINEALEDNGYIFVSKGAEFDETLEDKLYNLKKLKEETAASLQVTASKYFEYTELLEKTMEEISNLDLTKLLEENDDGTTNQEIFHWNRYLLKKMKNLDKTYGEYIYDTQGVVLWLKSNRGEDDIIYSPIFDARTGDLLITSYYKNDAIFNPLDGWSKGIIAHQMDNPLQKLSCDVIETIPA